MPEHDPRVLSYSHLRDFPRAPDALRLLRQVASLVKPLMRSRRWAVGELSEFYPDQANLLGLNINKGQRILLRLRYPSDRSLFLPLEMIADTLLHELAHIVHGPHDAAFHALWNQLRDDHMALVLKGYTGEGFLSEGRRLGGGTTAPPPVPIPEARRLARALERRRHGGGHHGAGQPPPHGGHGGHRLGGGTAAAQPGVDMRRVIAEAAARRNAPTNQGKLRKSHGKDDGKPKPKHRHHHHHHHHSSTKTLDRGCATTGRRYDDQARAALAAQATRNGFCTQAEEDAANDAAIAQALWELVQEEEDRRRGHWGRRLGQTPGQPLASASGSKAASGRPQGGRPQGVGEKLMDISSDSDSDSDSESSCSSSSSSSSSSDSDSEGVAGSDSGWTCGACTLHNPGRFLCCDACGTERGGQPPSERAHGKSNKGKGRVVRFQTPVPSVSSGSSGVGSSISAPPASRPLTDSSEPPVPPPIPPPPAVWVCTFCARQMARQFWTCDLCGTLKQSWQ